MRVLLFSVLLYISSLNATSRDYVITNYGAHDRRVALSTIVGDDVVARRPPYAATV